MSLHKLKLNTTDKRTRAESEANIVSVRGFGELYSGRLPHVQLLVLFNCLALSGKEWVVFRSSLLCVGADGLWRCVLCVIRTR